MRDTYWSIGLGVWGGIQVRLHASFLAFGAFTLFLSSQEPETGMLGLAALSLLVLLFSVVVHEIAHGLMALRVGGSMDQMVLSPLGGLVPPTVPANHLCQLLTAISGPAANLALVVLTAIPIVILKDGVTLIGLLNPIAPREALTGPLGIVALKLLFWINWMLVLANLLPAPPLDGGRLLRAILAPTLGARRAVLAVAGVARLVAVALFCAAILLRHETASFPLDGGIDTPTVSIPLWAPLVLLSFAIFFGATVELEKSRDRRLGDELVGFDFGPSYGDYDGREPPERAEPGPIRRWLERRREIRERQRQLLEDEEDCRVDDILARLHAHGPQSLTPADRTLLARASARYRNRGQRSQ